MRNVHARQDRGRARVGLSCRTELAVDLRSMADAILSDLNDAERRAMLEAMKQEIIAAMKEIDQLVWPAMRKGD